MIWGYQYFRNPPHDGTKNSQEINNMISLGLYLQPFGRNLSPKTTHTASNL